MPRAGLERDGDIPATCVDDALGQNGAKLGHDVFVFIADDFGVKLSNVFDFGRSEFRVLDEDQGWGQQRSLAHVIDWVIHHGLQ